LGAVARLKVEQAMAKLGRAKWGTSTELLSAELLALDYPARETKIDALLPREEFPSGFPLDSTDL
jgi:hypothetical protein